MKIHILPLMPASWSASSTASPAPPAIALSGLPGILLGE